MLRQLLNKIEPMTVKFREFLKLLSRNSCLNLRQTIIESSYISNIFDPCRTNYRLSMIPNQGKTIG